MGIFNVEEIYIIILCAGAYEDYSETLLFATFDEKVAENWVDRFNNIIINNKERIDNYYDDGDYDKPDLYLYDLIKWDPPFAKFKKLNIK